MLVLRYLLGALSALLLTQADTPNDRPSFLRRRPSLPQAHPLKQATRAQIVTRATKPRQRRQAVSVQPYPQCADYAATGPVPYARWTGLDYASAVGARYHASIPTRESCTKICELAQDCIISTYNLNSLDCYEVVNEGVYFLGTFQATIKGVSCESSTALIEQYRDASCCTEYRAATPA